MNTLNKILTRHKLQAYKASVIPQDNEDEAAFEHQAEVEHVIEAIDAGQSDKQIYDAAEYVGLTYLLVPDESSLDALQQDNINRSNRGELIGE